ncbi:MAG: hypothetical protein FWD73_08175 [Polyangiaceae bacterium]|nr:hypothetical protein [Polyangiaceae bacterium]
MSKILASKRTGTSTAPTSESDRERSERRQREWEEQEARNRRIEAQERDEAPVWRPYDHASGVEPLGYLVALAISNGEDGELSFATGALDVFGDDVDVLRLALLADGDVRPNSRACTRTIPPAKL